MKMYGKLLIIAGFPCSGKTTYINAIHDFFGSFISRRIFYTNRQPRSREEFLNSTDYKFIANPEYAKLSNQTDWHWAKWYDFDYGFHMESEVTRLQKGEKIVIGTAPHISYLYDMQKIHGKNNVSSILLYVDYKTIVDRLKKRPQHEHKRILAFDQNEIDEYSRIADVVFKPKKDLLDDCKKILAIATQMLHTNNQTSP